MTESVEERFSGAATLKSVAKLAALFGLAALAAKHALSLTWHAEGSALDLYPPAAGWSTLTGVIALVLLVGFAVSSLVGSASPGVVGFEDLVHESAGAGEQGDQAPRPCGRDLPPTPPNWKSPAFAGLSASWGAGVVPFVVPI